MRHVVCGMWYVVCGMQCVACGMWYAVQAETSTHSVAAPLANFLRAPHHDRISFLKWLPLPSWVSSSLAMTTIGMDLAVYSTIVVKSMQHFRGAFGPIARDIIVADSGALSSCLTLPTFPFAKVRRPVYPIDLDTVWI
jgi:hypothetical protein